jgi:oligopeptide/dipeptide ABC transporter ATP-binding protein
MTMTDESKSHKYSVSTDEVEKYILVLEDFVKYFPITGGVLNRTLGYVRAVDHINLKIPRGKTVGIVGESGCGKTTLGRTILRLIEPTSGKMIYNERTTDTNGNETFKTHDLSTISSRGFRKYRKNMQIVFQDPYASMNPRMVIKSILREPLQVHHIIDKKKLNLYILSVLREVGLDKEHLNRYPHEFSGGQRQRICIARALMVNPDLLILDEPTASVDVSVQARVLNLLKDIQKRRGLSFIFISHDLSVVTHMADTVVVMYLGVIMEVGPKEIFSLSLDKTHPYTNALASAVPIPDPTFTKERVILHGDVPSPVNPPSGCRFHTRCPIAEAVCSQEVPELREISEDHYIACHFR